jgi:hypothetical protein
VQADGASDAEPNLRAQQMPVQDGEGDVMDPRPAPYTLTLTPLFTSLSTIDSSPRVVARLMLCCCY